MDFLILARKPQIEAIRKQMVAEGREKDFRVLLPYLKAGIAVSDAISFQKEVPKDKNVRPYNPATGEYEEPIRIYRDRLDSALGTGFEKFFEEGYSLLFYGYNGSGKTHTASYFLASSIEMGRTGYLASSSSLYKLPQ